MTFDFFMGLAIGALFIGAAAILIAMRTRPAAGEITEWQEAAYHPADWNAPHVLSVQPRAVTRLTKNDLTWEI